MSQAITGEVRLSHELREPPHRAVLRALVLVALVAALLSIAFAVFRFNTMEWGVCQGVKANDADYCTLYDFKCVAKPDHCEDNWKGFIARDRFHLTSIVYPHLKASVLGFLWCALQLLGAAVLNLVLFAVLVIREPMLLSPIFWCPVLVGLIALAYRDEAEPTPRTRAEPFRPLNRVGRESPLGEATFARPSEAHEALGGSVVPVAPPPLFED